MPSTTSSTLTPRKLILYARTFDWCIPVVGLAGYDDEPALSFCNDIMQKIMAENNPWKWNSYPVSPFLTQPYQQDYPTNLSSDLMGWLESGTFVDINNPASTSQFFVRPPIRAVARLLPTYQLGVPGEVCWIMNRNAQTGTWPGAGVLYQNPLTSQGGGPGSNPLTAITDPNGNIQVVTTYGTTGSGPTWPAANAAGGTVTQDGSVQWTVQDPNGVAFRLNALATFNSNVWLMNLTYQQKPPQMTTLSQTFFPIPDDLQYLVKQGFLAYCYKKADKKTFQIEYTQWLADIKEALGASDRETQEFGLAPSEPLSGGSGLQGGGYGYVGWPGWSSGGS